MADTIDIDWENIDASQLMCSIVNGDECEACT